MKSKEINDTPDNIKKAIDHKEKKKNTIKGLQMNIRNLKKNVEQFKIMLDRINIFYDFIGLTECWSSEKEVDQSQISIHGYDNVHTKNKFNQNGGIHMYIKSTLNWRIIDGIDIEETESMAIEINKGKKSNSYVVIIIYRNPNRNENTFIESLANLVNKMMRTP